MFMKLLRFGLLILIPILLDSCEEKMEIAKSGVLVPQTVDEDAKLPSFRSNGILLHAESFGPKTGPMLVMIHGGPGGDYRYLLNAKDLVSNGYQVVFFDQRGSGLSQRIDKKDYPKEKGAIINLLYDDLKKVIEQYRRDPQQEIILFGHSWGAMLASGFAGRYPSLIKGMVLCEPGGLKWADVETYVKNSRSLNVWSEALNNATYLDQFITGAENDHAILDYKMSMFSSSNPITGEGDFDKSSSWRDGAIISTVMFEEADRDQLDFSAGIENFNKPILFFYSSKNKAYPDQWTDKITSVFKTVKKVKIQDVGHDGIITNADAWSQQTKPNVLSFLNNLK